MPEPVWTLATLKEHFDALRAADREAVATALAAAEKAVAAAMAASEKAILKAENAADKRAEASNEIRGAMVDAIQKGKSVSDLGDLLDQAAAGLEASAPKAASQAPSPAFWDFLLKLIEMLLPLLIH